MSELTLNKLKVYSRENCHLCHDMVEDLRLWQTRLTFEFEVIEIDGDAKLLPQFALMVPVLTQDNQVLCFGRLDVTVLRAAL